jgi:hypothetical protein
MNAPMTLYVIDGDFRALEDLLEQAAEGASEADAAVVSAWLEELHGKLDEKAERCVRYIRTQEAMRDALVSEAERLKARAAVHDNRVKRLKEALRFVMSAAGTKKIETPAGAVSLVANGGKQPVALLVPLDAVPDGVCRFEKKIDDEKIREALEAAGGTTDYATLQARGFHIRVK